MSFGHVQTFRLNKKFKQQKKSLPHTKNALTLQGPKKQTKKKL